MKGKIFNAQEVQAIIAGNKTMFREIVKRKKTVWQYKLNENGIREVPCPYQVGQKIFCKESFLDYFALGILSSGRAFKADYPKAVWTAKWKPAQHMKQKHSRLTLLIKEIRVERLAEISCADYFAETGRRPISHMDLDCDTPDPRNDFAAYWNATHKKPGEKFEASPWVWCVSFEVINN